MALVYNFDDLVSNSFVGQLMKFDIFKNIPDGLELSFSIYKNGTPGSGKTEERRILAIHPLDDSSSILVPDGFEIGFNSCVTVFGRHFHIPLIDFIYSNNDQDFVNGLDILKTSLSKKLYILDTGRSFHGYFDVLLNEIEWRGFLGNLLLLNKVNSDSLIDSRWVGHSLIQGFSTLRLTSNTVQYRKTPAVIKIY